LLRGAEKMGGVACAGVVVVFLVLGVGLWALSSSLDSWAPFGKGWFGEKNDRIYEVVYYDARGDQHWATCKTSLLSGVYWADDRITHRRAGWYDSLPGGNDPGDPVIRHIPDSAEEERIEAAAAEALGLPEPEEPTTESLDEEIRRLQQRLAELERKKRERGA
jgi:hypothetical protein